MKSWLRQVILVIWVLAALSVLSGLFLTVVVDRDGGVTGIVLRHSPRWQGRTFVSTDEAKKLGTPLVWGNENGVHGEEVVEWFASTGSWVFPTTALVLSLLIWRTRATSRS